MGFSLQGKWSFKWFFRLLVSINIHYLPNWYTFNWKIKNLTIWSTRALFSSLIIFFFKMGQLRPLFRLFLVFSSKQYNSDNKSKKMFTQYTAPGFEPTTFLTWVVTRPIKWYFWCYFGVPNSPVFIQHFDDTEIFRDFSAKVFLAWIL